jgi:hypothetical protein
MLLLLTMRTQLYVQSWLMRAVATATVGASTPPPPGKQASQLRLSQAGGLLPKSALLLFQSCQPVACLSSAKAML